MIHGIPGWQEDPVFSFDNLERPCGLPLSNRVKAVDGSAGSGFVRTSAIGQGFWTRHERGTLLKRVHTYNLLVTNKIGVFPTVSNSEAVVRGAVTGSRMHERLSYLFSTLNSATDYLRYLIRAL